MDTLTTQQKIERLERELADLRDKDRIEREEASKRKEAERRADFEKLKNAVQDYNIKYGEKIVLGVEQNTKTADSVFYDFFPWLRGE